MDSFCFSRWICFVVVVSETGKEPHRIQVSFADPKSRFGCGGDCGKNPAILSRQITNQSMLPRKSAAHALPFEAKNKSRHAGEA
jgi:hypothetical protein